MAFNSGYTPVHVDTGDFFGAAKSVRDMISQAQKLQLDREQQAMEALRAKFGMEQQKRTGDLYERQIQNSEATQKRMDRQDRGNAFLQAREMMAAGDIDGGMAHARSYGIDINELTAPQGAQAPQQPQQPAPAPQAQAPVPGYGDMFRASPLSSPFAGVGDALDNLPELAQQDAAARNAAVTARSPQEQVPTQPPQMPTPDIAGRQQVLASMSGGAGGEATFPPARAAQASVARNEAAAKALRRKFRIRGEDGEVLADEFDPQAVRDEQLARQDEDRARQEALASRRRSDIAGRWAVPSTGQSAQNPVTQEIFAVASDYLQRGDLTPKEALAEARADVLGRMSAQRPRSNGYRPTDPGGFKAADDARNDFTGYVSQTGYKLTRGEYYKYQQMADALNQENAALDSTTAGAWTKLAQGGTGVVSDNDVKVFWKRIGGLGVQGADQLEGILTGKISHPKRDLVLDAARWLSDKAAAKLQADREGAEVLMEKYGPNGQRYLRAYYGEAPGGGKATGGKAGAPDKVDLLLQKLGGK